MPSLTKVFALFSLALSASALTTPHAIRAGHHHREIAHVIAEREVLPPREVAARNTVALRRRKSNKGRCQAPTSSNIAKASTISVAAVNAAPTPPTEPKEKSTVKATSTTSSPWTKAESTQTTHTSSAAKPSSGGSAAGDFLAGTNTGEGTYYGTGLGACGITSTDSDMICAVSEKLFDVYPGYNGANPNNNPVCGRKIKATYGGKSVTVTVVDRCVACAKTDLDFAPAAFTQIADQALGRIYGMTWEWAS